MAYTTIPAAHRGANPATILQLEAERLRQLRDELDHLDDVEQIGPVLTDVANQLEALVESGAVLLSRDGAALVRSAGAYSRGARRLCKGRAERGDVRSPRCGALRRWRSSCSDHGPGARVATMSHGRIRAVRICWISLDFCCRT